MGDAVFDPEIYRACTSSLAQLGIEYRDVVATLVFGSKAKNRSTSRSDIDVVFFVKDDPRYPEFQYKRLVSDGGSVDANVIKPRCLDELCRRNTGWAYRLHLARPIRELTRVPEQAVIRWLGSIGKMVESELACRARLIRHLRDCRSLVSHARRLAQTEPAISKYLAIEVFFLVPLVYLNQRSTVPFQHGNPWNEALDAANLADTLRAEDYLRLVEAISGSELFNRLNGKGAFGRELKILHDECRQLVIGRIGNVFQHGFGARLAPAIERDPDLPGKLRQLTSSHPEVSTPLLDQVSHWLCLVRGTLSSSRLPGSRLPLRRRKSRQAGSRYVHYDKQTSRLKIILPTGGCREPVCHFCMLPYLARPKSDIEEIFVSAAAQSGRNHVRQLTVYTDGSFFDERELTRGEQRLIASKARELGAGELLVESLPKFLSPDSIGNTIDALGPGCRLRVGIGLQSAGAQVRRFITGTPITQLELKALQSWRKTAPFSLRIYLLANKPLLSAKEDRMDVHRSLASLAEWLQQDDAVTVNPLLPTAGTLAERIWKAGYWFPLSQREEEDLREDLFSKTYPYRLEIGLSSMVTCTDIPPAAWCAAGGANHETPGQDFAFFAQASSLPFSLLGGLRHREHWARCGFP
ncbi:MAG: hypothetical protein ACLP7P_07395 [Rhodomicrobium sp.]